jgi:hypothetical protein
MKCIKLSHRLAVTPVLKLVVEIFLELSTTLHDFSNDLTIAGVLVCLDAARNVSIIIVKSPRSLALTVTNVGSDMLIYSVQNALDIVGVFVKQKLEHYFSHLSLLKLGLLL